jgi:hypothetical protein
LLWVRVEIPLPPPDEGGIIIGVVFGFCVLER